MTLIDLNNIVYAGGNIIVDADKFSVLDLKKLCGNW